MTDSKIEQLIPIDRVWAIEHKTAQAIAEALEQIPAELRATSSTGEPKEYQMLGSVAVVEVRGPMTKGMTSVQRLFGGTSTVMARRQIRAAVKDKSVTSILMVFDSGGGQVGGTHDLADDVRKATQSKDVVAYIEDGCCSAALWVASQCTSIVAGASAGIGSIGAYTYVDDYSALYTMKGIKTHLVSSSHLKGVGVSGTTITPAQLADMQREIDDITDLFVAAVAQGRGMSIAQVEELATGQVWLAAEAKSLGLIDQVGDFDTVLTQMQRGFSPARAVAAGIQETHMVNNPENQGFLARIGASVLTALSGGSPSEPEVASAGPNPAATPIVQPVAPVVASIDPAVEERLRALEASNLQMANAAGEQLAETFASDLVVSMKAFPVEKEAIQNSFMLGLRADGSGNVSVDAAGKPIEGPNCAALREVYAKRPAHTMAEEIVRGTQGATVQVLSTGADSAVNELRERYFGATETGKKVLAGEK